MKLSQNQKDVILEMRKGTDLRKARFVGYSAVSYIGIELKFLHKQTFNSLYLKGLICINPKENNSGRTSTIYTLTDLGKNINLI